MAETVVKDGGVVNVIDESPENVRDLVGTLRELVKDAAPESEERLHEGKQARHLKFEEAEEIPRQAVRDLVRAAYRQQQG